MTYVSVVFGTHAWIWDTYMPPPFPSTASSTPIPIILVDVSCLKGSTIQSSTYYSIHAEKQKTHVAILPANPVSELVFDILLAFGLHIALA
jgi:hypothetical protein